MSFGHRHGHGKGAASGSLTAPTTVGTLSAWLVFENSGSQTYSAAGGFAGSALVFSLPAGATGVTIDSGSGVLTADTVATAIQTATALTVRATNGAGSADQPLSLTVAAVRRSRPINNSLLAARRATYW